ncbi:MAG: DUF2141 domain-containing protein [Chlorobi bacterium]|nr:DUF2141 domain-containing protein [Chlorobiota bacterium]
MIRFFLLGSVLLLVFASCFSQTADLTILFENIRSDSGTLKIGIFDDARAFKNKKDPVVGVKCSPKKPVTRFVARDLKPGKYAVAVFHDENSDDTLNFRAMGVPIEGIGFSGNVKKRIRPPGFALASFRLEKDTTIAIKMIYGKKKKPEK